MNYRGLTARRASIMLSRLGDCVEFRGETIKGIFRYPTEDDTIKRSGAPDYSGLKISLKNPEIWIFSKYEGFTIGEPLRVWDGRRFRRFLVTKAVPNGGALIRVDLAADTDNAASEAVPDGVDSTLDDSVPNWQ